MWITACAFVHYALLYRETVDITQAISHKMKIYKKEAAALMEFIKGKSSLRNTAEKLKYKSATQVYVKAFHLLKEKYNNHIVWTETTK